MFTPPKEILRNYALVLIDYALGGGAGVKEKEIIYLQFDSPALPLALECYRRILEKGAYPIVKMNEDAFSKIFYDIADDRQLTFFPKNYMKSLVDTIDHRMYLMADRDPMYLRTVDPKKIMKANSSAKLMKKWLFDKEDQGKLTWTLALYTTAGMAKEAGLSEQKYWDQIIRACFLDSQDPIKKWKKTVDSVVDTYTKLNKLPVKKLHLTAKDTDLWIDMGKSRKWLGGSGRNIPSFEIFTSPDWRGTSGHVFFDYPLYRYGNIIKDIYIEFKNGLVTKVKAAKNQKLLEALVKQQNADKIGEYSLTDHRVSKIDHFMANTLFDENFGGEWGNTHMALGSSYHDAYVGDPKKLTEKDWEGLGYNESPEHTDIIATTKRTVEATLSSGTKKQIYKDGEFTLD